MKKIIFSVLLLISSFKMDAQVTFEQSYYIYHSAFYPIDIGNSNYKYVVFDSSGFVLYNLDHSLYLAKTVPPIPLWQPPTYYEVAYISNSLFDCDSSNIEYVVTQGNFGSNFYIYRTDGTLLFQKDSVTGPYNIGGFDGSLILQPIFNTPSGTKLMLQDNNGFDYDSVYVYSLCGTLPESVVELPLDKSYVQVFPNPSNGVVKFRINHTSNQKKYKISIYNSSFQMVDEATIIGKDYQLDTRQKALTPGMYLFVLKIGSKVFQTGKFIVTN